MESLAFNLVKKRGAGKENPCAAHIRHSLVKGYSSPKVSTRMEAIT